MNKLQKRGALILLAGLLLVAVALCMHLLQQKQDSLAGETAALILQQLELDRPVVQPDATQADPERPATQMPAKVYLGYHMLGSIQVPSVGIHLPVLDNWDEQMLKAAPCRYTGGIATGDMIIMGHNYKSHFTPLHHVAVGDRVIFTDVQGVIYYYNVSAIEQLHRTEGELLPSEYPLTLFTCSPGGLNRLVIRCERAMK